MNLYAKQFITDTLQHNMQIFVFLVLEWPIWDYKGTKIIHSLFTYLKSCYADFTIFLKAGAEHWG